MLKKTVAILGIATLAGAGAANALPEASIKPVTASSYMQLAACSPCAAKNPCNPCAAKKIKLKNPCNPCAAKNPCGAKKK